MKERYRALMISCRRTMRAGHDLFMPRVIVRAMDYPEEKALTLPEAFYLATKGGGALAIFYLSWFF